VKPDIILFDIMMEPMDGWETLEKIKENSATEKSPVLMFPAKKITPAEAKEHSINIDDFVSKPVSPSQLPDLIQWIFSRRNNIKGQLLVAQNKGLDPAVINEYSALRKRIDVDKNLLLVLRSSCGMNTPGAMFP
jgi:DNA-binding response OmpR family regulator